VNNIDNQALHVEKGLTPGWTPADVRMALNGALNSYVAPPGAAVRNRIPVTPFILKKIRLELAKTDWALQLKRMLWCFCCWAYVGSFR